MHYIASKMTNTSQLFAFSKDITDCVYSTRPVIPFNTFMCICQFKSKRSIAALYVMTHLMPHTRRVVFSRSRRQCKTVNLITMQAESSLQKLKKVALCFAVKPVHTETERTICIIFLHMQNFI